MPFDAMTLASSWWENVSKMTGIRSGNFKQRRTLSNDGWDTGYSLFIPRHGVGGLGAGPAIGGAGGNFHFPGGGGLLSRGWGALPSGGGGGAGFFRHKMDIVGDDPHAALGLAVFFPAVLAQAPLHDDPAAFGQVFGAVFRGRAPDLHVEIGHLRRLLAVFGVHPVVGEREAAHGLSRRCVL